MEKTPVVKERETAQKVITRNYRTKISVIIITILELRITISLCQFEVNFLDYSGGVQPVQYNHNQSNYGSVAQSGYHSPDNHIYQNMQNQTFQTFYRPQISSPNYPTNSAGHPLNHFIPKNY